MTALNANPSLKIASDQPARRSMLSRIWPFSARRIHHHTFGPLKPWRNGNYLRTRTEFVPLNREIWLVIRADSTGPTKSQEKLYSQIEKQYAALTPRILKSLFAEYQKVRQIQTAVPWPEIASPADLDTVIPLDAIWLERGEGHPFVFSYQSELDKDHEFHVFFRNGKLTNISFEH